MSSERLKMEHRSLSSLSSSDSTKSIWRVQIIWEFVLGCAAVLVLGAAVFVGHRCRRRRQAQDASEAPVLTMTGRSDGFGAQFQAMLAVLAAAKAHKLSFVFTDIQVSPYEHDTPDQDVAKLLGGFRDAFPRKTGQRELVSLTLLGKKDLKQRSALRSFEGVLETLRDIHFGATPGQYYTPEFRAEIRALYMKGASRRPTQPGIVVHIRRGDVKPGTARGAQRYVLIGTYVEIIQKLLERHPSENIHICSEGNARDFQELRACAPHRVMLRLNEDFASTFHRMVTGAWLVTARSSFSYTAALLRCGPVYYMPFWHAALPNWVCVERSFGLKVHFS